MVCRAKVIVETKPKNIKWKECTICIDLKHVGRGSIGINCIVKDLGGETLEHLGNKIMSEGDKLDLSGFAMLCTAKEQKS